ncbi:hypothetical protein HYY71_05740 [Candidatus Woesearchaeota archaeon]|nr:hypothetical protein [Candidatus Woesearchaeota archaeon]
MEKITKDAIKAVVAIIIGFGAIFKFEQTLAGIILIAVGTIIIGINPDLRSISVSFCKWLWGKATGKDTQRMESSVVGVQQQARRDAVVGEVVNTGKIINHIIINKNQDDYDKKLALKTIYKKMVEPLRLLNFAANVGIKDKEEFDNISKAVEEFIKIKMENELELDEELLDKLNNVMAAFRHTKHELFLKLNKNKFNDGLHGLEYFDFVMKCKETTEEIKKRLK